MEIIDEALLALGESVRQAIYWHLENKYNLKKDEIINKLNEFDEALKGMLGVGARVLLKIVVKRLYEKLGLKLEEEPKWNFKDYIECAKKKITLT
ncbi:hypothetical protein KEJ50_05545 [Candidatus Bathyarchaeota archaeon]|nr:hypothetical protein [Candidatus Bathyarchaeota archaeon]